MLTSSLRHMCAVGHTFGIEWIEGGVIVEIERLDALAAADLDECKVEIKMLQTVRSVLRLFFLSHRIGDDQLRLGEIVFYQTDKRTKCTAIGIGIGRIKLAEGDAMVAVVAAALNDDDIRAVLHHRCALNIAVLSSLLLCDVSAADAVVASLTAQTQTEQNRIIDLLGLDALIIDQNTRV